MIHYVKVKLHIILLNLCKLWICFKCRTPQGRAFTIITFEEYKKTTMYRDRLIHFGEQFAMEQYLENREFKFFARKVPFSRKLAAFFAPYFYIDRYYHEN